MADDNQDNEGGGVAADNNADEASEVDADETADDEDQGDGETTGDNIGGNGSGSVLPIQAVSNLDSLYGLREIGREALCWQLSSAKPGNGVEQIRDQSTDTYWQSDGVSQPHLIQVHFARRVAISHICLYLDFNLDESYTPKNISVQVGMTTQDLVPAIFEASIVELNEPVGWCIIPLTSRRIVRTHLIQIEVCSMHQNGRDTHVRQVQLYGPRTTMNNLQNESPTDGISNAAEIKKRSRDDEFSTISMSQFSVLR
ncbi:APC10-domain-containing protein [Fragilariopsis cylindrus CCMP1102]|uniref:APC10-domain-containing protein n=1 Tax=Fragilariopsis cylindrus CCMP1102 TaxID=635003 RepID=A0A1E7EXR0_9STRA|nr:APC10-domain-containing protein [Fragilariopsis cylindrus CCMP1102]|eukprot:OEU10637.1 APC10-domain-containing protein [Fragilariopsis cylindrus CCMP1102]